MEVAGEGGSLREGQGHIDDFCLGQAAPVMYFDGLSYRRTAENIGEYFGRDTTPGSVYAWVRDLSRKADEVLKPMKVDAGDVWVADEIVVNVGGKNYWLFNVMDSDSRFLLAEHLSPVRTSRAAATALALTKEWVQNPAKQLKTDGLRSFRELSRGCSVPAW